jgi:hypothetical protein
VDVFAIYLLHAKKWQVGVTVARNARHASLREDYLNQVQRDFLSQGTLASYPNTPSEFALASKAEF